MALLTISEVLGASARAAMARRVDPLTCCCGSATSRGSMDPWMELDEEVMVILAVRSARDGVNGGVLK